MDPDLVWSGTFWPGETRNNLYRSELIIPYPRALFRKAKIFVTGLQSCTLYSTQKFFFVFSTLPSLKGHGRIQTTWRVGSDPVKSFRLRNTCCWHLFMRLAHSAVTRRSKIQKNTPYILSTSTTVYLIKCAVILSIQIDRKEQWALFPNMDFVGDALQVTLIWR